MSPNHSLNARVRTVTHCSGVSSDGFPFGAFSHVPFAFAARSISARSASVAGNASSREYRSPFAPRRARRGRTLRQSLCSERNAFAAASIFLRPLFAAASVAFAAARQKKAFPQDIPAGTPYIT